MPDKTEKEHQKPKRAEAETTVEVVSRTKTVLQCHNTGIWAFFSGRNGRLPGDMLHSPQLLIKCALLIWSNPSTLPLPVNACCPASALHLFSLTYLHLDQHPVHGRLYVLSSPLLIISVNLLVFFLCAFPLHAP